MAVTQIATKAARLLLAVALDPREIGQRIKAARERAGETQLSFALRSNVSPSTVARWEQGKLPPVRELMRIAELLDVPAEFLMEPPETTTEIQDLRVQVEALADQLDRIEQLLLEPPSKRRAS